MNYFLLILFILGLGCKPEQTLNSNSKGVVATATKWDTNNINVCWHETANNYINNTVPYHFQNKRHFSNLKIDIESYIIQEFKNKTNIIIQESPWPTCHNQNNYVVAQRHMISIGHQKLAKAIGRSYIGNISQYYFPSMEMDFTYLNPLLNMADSSRTAFIVSVLHEFFHAIGGRHEHERDDKFSPCITQGSIYKTLVSEDYVKYKPNHIYIGAFDDYSISNYCRYSENIGFSSIDAFSIAYLYGFPKVDSFIELIRQKTPEKLLRTKINEINYPIRSSYAYDPKYGDLILWIQLWMHNDPNIDIEEHGVVFTSTTSESLAKYQKIYDIESDPDKLGTITKKTVDHFIGIHNKTITIKSNTENLITNNENHSEDTNEVEIPIDPPTPIINETKEEEKKTKEEEEKTKEEEKKTEEKEDNKTTPPEPPKVKSSKELYEQYFKNLDLPN